MQKLLVVVCACLCAVASGAELVVEKVGGDARDASVFYEKAFKRMEEFPPGQNHDMLEFIRNGFADAGLEALRYAEKDRGIVDIVREAVAIEKCDFMRGRKIAIDTPFPHIQKLRMLARYLVFKGVYFDGVGRNGDAMECFMLAAGIPRHVECDGVLIARFAATQIDKLVLLGLERTFEYSSGLRQKALHDLLLYATERVSFKKTLETECAMWDALKDEISREGLNIGFDKKEISADLTLVLGEDREEFMAILDRKVATLLRPFMEAARLKSFRDMQKASKALKQRTENFGREKVAMLVALAMRVMKYKSDDAEEGEKVDKRLKIMGEAADIAALGMANMAMTYCSYMSRDLQARFRQMAIVLRFALSIYKDKHKTFPPDMKSLVAEGLIPRIFIDPFDGLPLRYVSLEKGEQCMVYSVGQDLQDNEGRIVYDRQLKSGDLVSRIPGPIMVGTGDTEATDIDNFGEVF